MRILSINVRGFGSPVKWRYIKDIIRKEGVRMVCLQEVRMVNFSFNKCCQLWGDSDIDYLYSEPSNGAGGILTIWHNKFFLCSNRIISSRFNVFIGIFKENSIPVVIVNVYSSCNLIDKMQMWEDLKKIRYKEPCKTWCMLGDFNSVRREGERKEINGARGNKREMQGFNNFIDELELLDIPCIGRKFTWYRPNGKTKSRLDRVLTTLEWLQYWPGCKQYVLDRQISDHCALLLKSNVVDWGPKPFRFLDIWQEDKEFDKFVKGKWESYVVKGNEFAVVKEKLKMLKSDLKGWNKEVFGYTDKIKLDILRKIQELDMRDDLVDLEEDKIRERRELLSQLQDINVRNESLLQQKSRALWLKQRDTNSKYFHASIKWRRLRNEIKGIQCHNSGNWVEELNAVKELVKEFYKEKLTAIEDIGVRLDNVHFEEITESDNRLLTDPFDEEEIKEAIWNCDGQKSPGPDGVTFSFIKMFWGLVNKEVVGALKYFHKEGKIPKGCNASFLTLIPKSENPQSLEEYRPISLVGCLYKIVTKVLSKRVKKVIEKVIDGSQSAFLSNRGLLDSVLVVNEVLDDLKRRRKSGVIMKLDFEKAYDSVSWEFLFYMMGRLGFCERWIQWIRACLESATISVLVNGSPTKEFKPSRGLR